MKNVKPISLIMLIFAVALFSSYHIYNYCLYKFNNKIVDKYIEIESTKKNYPLDIVDKKEDAKEEFLGVLEIPKINLKKGFYNITSINNNVNKNIQILTNSQMPDIPNSTMIIAAHSGNSYLGYFKKLNQLLIGDQISIYYHNKKYTYVISSSYETLKNGELTIIKNTNEKVLVLTTCSKNNNQQLVVMSKLLKEENLF